MSSLTFGSGVQSTSDKSIGHVKGSCCGWSVVISRTNSISSLTALLVSTTSCISCSTPILVWDWSQTSSSLMLTILVFICPLATWVTVLMTMRFAGISPLTGIQRTGSPVHFLLSASTNYQLVKESFHLGGNVY